MGEGGFVFALWAAAVYSACSLPPDNSSLLNRWRRQTCGFRCKSGQCIDLEQLCDGKANCSDESDETREACSTMSCPPYAFQCFYGACVDGDVRCNGKNDCFDNSDEKGCPHTGPACRTDQFRCESGSCMPFSMQCDGRRDCPDGSDESASACKSIRCEAYAFQCKYGACIDGNFEADGVCQCADGSDEPKGVCGDGSSTPTGNAPPVRVNGTKVCDPPLAWQGPTPRDTGCEGEGGVILVLDGTEAEAGEFPWHTAIYRTETYICGGSLISSRLVLSAAHCFWNSEKNDARDVSQYLLVAGKFHRALNPPEQKEIRMQVSEIKLNCFYQHNKGFYDNDIAIIILKSDVIFTRFVRPICIDWKQQFVAEVKQGVVAGWGYNATYQAADTLHKVTLPRVDIDTCREMSPDGYQLHMSKRKFCAGFKNGTGACNGDSGGGMMFQKSLWYISGIVSTAWSNGTSGKCSQKDFALFTDINEFLPWIRLIYQYAHPPTVDFLN